jgi:cyclase
MSNILDLTALIVLCFTGILIVKGMNLSRLAFSGKMYMVQRERVAENVYFFQSDSYALVTAGVIAGPQWAVVIDTLPTPDETLNIREYIEQELGVPVRYVINTHYHADHTWGNYFFPGATIIAHSLCRELLEKKGTASLEIARRQNPVFRNVDIVLPHITFETGEISLKVGKKTLTIMPLPGHSIDGVGVLVEEDRVLFSGDAFMPLPYIVDGDIEEQMSSLKLIGKLGLENIIQGHGDIVLRGEIEGAVKDNLNYLSALRKAVRKAGRRRYPWDILEEVDVESCGKSRVLIGGLAPELHARNLKALYRQIFGEIPAASDDEDD